MTSTQAMPAVATAAFQPSLVSAITRSQWCQSQEQVCPDICTGSVSTNLCSTNDLSWTCLCSNGTVPDVTAFIDTLPYYICQETFSQCMGNNIDNAQEQHQCTKNGQCGTRNATAEYFAYRNPAAASTVTIVASPTSSSTMSNSTSSPIAYTSAVATTSSSSSSTTSSIAAPATSSSSHARNSPGTLIGIAVGSAIGGILMSVIVFLLYRRRKGRRRNRQDADTSAVPESLPTNSATETPVMQDGRLEFPGDGEKYGSRGEGGMITKAEMLTDRNRHELDNAEISGILNSPWNDEMEGRHELGDKDSLKGEHV